MVEIKRTRAGQSYLNKPIGVVNVRTGAEKVYEAKAKTAETFGNIAFDFAKQTQIKQGAEYAKEVLVEDENGIRGYQQVPKHLGAYGRDEANRIYQKRYTDALQADTRNFAKQLRQVETDPVRFQTVYNDYVKQTLLDIDKSGGGDVASVIASDLYDIGKLHVNDIQTKNLALKEKESQLNYLSIVDMRKSDLSGLSGEDLVNSKNALIEDIRESAVSDYGFSPTKTMEMINNVNDEYALSVFTDEAKDLPVSALVALQDRSQWDNPIIAEKFKDTISVIKKFDSTRLSEFYSRVSNIANDRNALQTQQSKINFTSQQLELGQVVNNADTRKNIDSVMAEIGAGYANPFSALTPSQAQSDLENNLPLPSDSLYTLAKVAQSGFANPSDIVPFAVRLAQIDAAQSAKGRGLREYFGGDLGTQMESLLSMTKSIGRMGEEDLVRAYQQRYERNSMENLEVARRNSSYEGKDDASLTEMASFYVNKNLSDLPTAAREEAITQVGYMLTFETPGDIDDAVKDFVARAYKPSEFYERYSENNNYSKYINNPEVYFVGEELDVFRAKMMSVGKQTNADRYLEPIQSSAAGASWMIYELDSRGAKNYIVDANGYPTVLYSKNFKKSYAVQRDNRIEELNFMRGQSLTAKQRSEVNLDSPMRLVD